MPNGGRATGQLIMVDDILGVRRLEESMAVCSLGNQFDLSYCCVIGSREGPVKPPLKHEFELDVSVYGVAVWVVE